MIERARLRKAGILCLHCLRNFAYFRVADEQKPLLNPAQFWITIHNNFLDVGILEWCKLFADAKGKHFWRKVLNNQDGFFKDLLNRLNLTEEMFIIYIGEVKEYRDKFVAHLDDGNVMNIPNLVPAIKAAQHLYKYLLDEDAVDVFSDAPSSPIAYYRERLAHSRNTYAKYRSADVENGLE